MNSLKQTEAVAQLQREYPSVSKKVIENELMKADGDLRTTKKSLNKLDESIATLNEIILEKKKEYIIDSDSDQDMESEDSKESSDEKDCDKDINFIKSAQYESQDESEDEEIDKICLSNTKTLETAGKPTSDFIDEDSEQFFEYISLDLMQQFEGVPKECVSEIVKYFYPNMGKIEFVLAEFQKQLYLYTYDKDNHRKGRKERAKKYKEKKRSKKEIILPEEIQKIVNEVADIKDKIKEGKDTLSKPEIKELRSKIKELKSIKKTEQKKFKHEMKEERRRFKLEAKNNTLFNSFIITLKNLRDINNQEHKEEKQKVRDEERKQRGEKDYEDDVFFREIRREPQIIKQVIKQTKKDLRKAQKSDNQEAIEFCKNKLLEYENSLDTEIDKVISLTYERYTIVCNYFYKFY